MLVQEHTLGGEDIFQLPLVIDVPHAFLSAAVRDGGTETISTCVFIIPCSVFQPAEWERPDESALTSMPMMSDRGR